MRDDRRMLPGDIVTASARVGRAAVHKSLGPSERPVAVLGCLEVATVIASTTGLTWMGTVGFRECLVLLPHTCTVGWVHEDELERV